VSQRPDLIPEGLPDHLPEGEQLVWHGKPDWRRLAVSAFHVRKVAIYFAAIAGLETAYGLAQGDSFADAARNVPFLAACAILACDILAIWAWATARTTDYTLTTKRALIRSGLALPVIINLPFRQIDGASFALTGQGHGNICLKPGGGTRLAKLLLWPHSKPWNLTKPQPAFREIANAEAVATRLAFMLGGAMPQPETQARRIEPGFVAAE
jgi:hypothetical protein